MGPGSGGGGSLAGDVTGTPNATVVERIQGRNISSVAPVANQVLAWTGASWAPSNPGFHTGNGTANTLAKYTGASTQDNSSITDDGSVVQTPLQIRSPIFYDRDNTGYYLDPASTTNTNVMRFNVADCLNGTCPPNNAIRMTPNFHLNSGAGYAVILNWDTSTTGSNQTFRIGNVQGSDVFYVYADGSTSMPIGSRATCGTGESDTCPPL